MTLRTVFAGLAVLGAFAAAIAHAQPRRGASYSVDNHGTSDDVKLKLTQLHPEETAWIVKSSDGQSFTDAELQDSDVSPWRLKAEFECPAGKTYDGATHPTFDSPGFVKEFNLQGMGFDNLLAANLSPGLMNANQGAVETSLWTQHAKTHWAEVAKEAVIAACNSAAAQARSRSPGISQTVALSRAGVIYPYADGIDTANAVSRPSLKARCESERFQHDPGENEFQSIGNNVHTAQTDQLQLKLAVKCESPVAPPTPGSSVIAAVFGVSDVTLTADPVFVKGACPRTVRFDASVTASRAGPVRYRIRGSDGSLSGVQTVNIAAAGEPVSFHFDRTFGEQAGGFTPPPPPPPPRPGGLTPQGPSEPTQPVIAAPALPPKPPTPPTGPGGIAPQTAEGEHSGWMRVEIISPSTSKTQSREAHYKVICEAASPPSNIAVAPPGGRQPAAPPRRGARPEGERN